MHILLPKKKGEKKLESSDLEKALDFFYSYFKSPFTINFTGGEPLLSFEEIQRAVNFIEKKNKQSKKKARYALTTNGFLIDETILNFLSLHNFSICVSFDGKAQEVSRQKRSFDQIVTTINKLREKDNIDLSTNSVFDLETVGLLSPSIKLIMELDIPDVRFSLDKVFPWKDSMLSLFKREMVSLRKYALSFYEKTGRIPYVGFRKNSQKGIFACYAGRDRMAIGPDGTVWGCYLFFDYMRDKKDIDIYNRYCFGTLDSLEKKLEEDYPKIMPHYLNLRMDCFFTEEDFCLLCENFEQCVMCPVEAAFSTSKLGEIPNWICQVKKIIREEREIFWKEADPLEEEK